MGHYTNEKTLFVILRAIHASVFKPWVLSFFIFFSHYTKQKEFSENKLDEDIRTCIYCFNISNLMQSALSDSF